MMNKMLCLCGGLLLVGACAFHAKQPVDDTYYKNTQSIAWPESTPAVGGSAGVRANAGGAGGSGGAGGASWGSAAAADKELNWQDPTAAAPEMAAPAMPEKALKCFKADNGTYTCRLGQYPCGRGCKSDGSNCSTGYCLQSDCDDVMGQKWELVYKRGKEMHVCQHPSAGVQCGPYGNSGIECWNGNSYGCGWNCNKNGTQCVNGDDNCWSKYR